MLAKGLIMLCQESSSPALEIWPWRAKICQSPMLAWKIPMALPRRMWLGILSIASATFTK